MSSETCNILARHAISVFFVSRQRARRIVTIVLTTIMRRRSRAHSGLSIHIAAAASAPCSGCGYGAREPVSIRPVRSPVQLTRARSFGVVRVAAVVRNVRELFTPRSFAGSFYSCRPLLQSSEQSSFPRRGPRAPADPVRSRRATFSNVSTIPWWVCTVFPPFLPHSPDRGNRHTGAVLRSCFQLWYFVNFRTLDDYTTMEPYRTAFGRYRQTRPGSVIKLLRAYATHYLIPPAGSRCTLQTAHSATPYALRVIYHRSSSLR